jgi:glutathione S-transferase
MLTLYHADMSPCAQKVRLALAAKELAYEGHRLDLLNKQNLEPGYLAINPKGLVPALVDGDAVITESTIICEYLDDRFPDRPLRPADPALAARMRSWTKLVDEKVHPVSGVLWFGAVMRHVFLARPEAERLALLAKVPDPARRDRQARMIAQGLDAAEVVPALHTVLDLLAQVECALIDGSWLVGERLTLADLAVAPYVRQAELLLPAETLGGFARTRAWLAELKSTPAYREGLAAHEPPATLAQIAALKLTFEGRLADLIGARAAA